MGSTRTSSEANIEKLKNNLRRIKAKALHKYFLSQSFSFSLHLITTFYTALKTKGFVILSGLSGTGKTKLAQHFAGLMPKPEMPQAETPGEQTLISLLVQPYMLKYSRMIIPKEFWKLVDVPPAGETHEIQIDFEDQGHTCRLTHADYGTTEYLQLILRGDARQWFESNFEEGQTIELEPVFDDENWFLGFKLCKPGKKTLQKSPNYHFAAVRPDWRDAKPLLGYYNPLTETYEFTSFLRFILQADADYGAHGLAAKPHFVLLDEMNLARVEYYLADFLSVLESGRIEDGDESGYTKESLCFQYPPQAGGELPPRQLRLPPNLYIVGTVNVDETTHAFSPKVLDRAFTIEMTEVDLADYPVLPGDGLAENDLQALLDTLLPDFTREGRFAVIDKHEIAGFVRENDLYRRHLRNLNAGLRSYDLHFGYRVFDEIVAFLANAENSVLLAGFRDLSDAFDTAVLMKVLPKFHGPKSRLEKPLQAILGWARDPEGTESAQDRFPQDANDCLELRRSLDAQLASNDRHYIYPRTALKAVRMLSQLYTIGFASFA